MEKGVTRDITQMIAANGWQAVYLAVEQEGSPFLVENVIAWVTAVTNDSGEVDSKGEPIPDDDYHTEFYGISASSGDSEVTTVPPDNLLGYIRNGDIPEKVFCEEHTAWLAKEKGVIMA